MSKKPFGILIADTHHHKDNIKEVNDVLDQAIELALGLKVYRIFHLGDAFTNRIGQGLGVLLAFKRWLGKCEDAGIDVYLIPGNHDKTNLDSEESYLDVFSWYERVVVFSEQTIINFPKLTIGFMPYFKEDGEYPLRLAKLIEEIEEHGQKSNKKILFTHIEIDGAQMMFGGMIAKNDLKAKHFKVFDEVFVGHFHNRNDLGENIHYVGSARPANFGEDSEKGFTILYDDGSFEYVNAKFKKYIKVSIDLDRASKKSLDLFKKKYEDKDDNVRFVLRGTEEQLSAIDSALFEDVGIEVKKEDKKVLKSIKAAENDEFIEFNKGTIMKSFLEYCKQNDILNEDRKLGLTYIKKI